MQQAPWSLKARIQELEAQITELQSLRGQVQRMQAIYGAPNCFLANTAFRKPDGTFKAVQDLEVGEAVRLANGNDATIMRKVTVPRAIQDLVELVTSQASLRVSAGHPIVTENGKKAAKDLILNERVIVGERMRPLTNVRAFQEGTQLFDIRFDPDAPIEAFVIPNYGIHVLGAAPPALELMQRLQNVPLEELMRAMPLNYHD